MHHTTVVIPAYRAWSTLPAVLDALAPQLTPDREAILVASGGDRPGGEFEDRWPWLQVVSSSARLFPGRARNVGAARGTGDLLAFLDADAVPCADWLNRLEEALTAETDGVAGAIVNGTPHSRVGTAEYLLSFSEWLPRRSRELRHGASCNLLLRRTAFEALGGFPENLRAGEDTVLTDPIARRRRLAFAPAATVQHLNRTDVASYLANQRVLGAGFIAVCRLVPFHHGWISRGPALVLAAPLRLMSLASCVFLDPSQRKQALRVFPLILLGLSAWMRGAYAARSGPRAAVSLPED